MGSVGLEKLLQSAVGAPKYVRTEDGGSIVALVLHCECPAIPCHERPQAWDPRFSGCPKHDRGDGNAAPLLSGHAVN